MCYTASSHFNICHTRNLRYISGAVMVLNERQNEQNMQKWISREKRERLDLSASVEETLEEPMVDEISWSEELDEQFGSAQSTRGKSVFPPRLSLQSRPVPALYADNSVESYLSSYAAAPVEQEKKTGPATQNQNSNMLKRFAQRLTSSFAALGGGQHEVMESVVQAPQEESVRRTKSSEPPIADESSKTSEPSRGPELRERIAPQRPVSSVGDEFHNRQSKQRLAGRTTRIHLETPPLGARSHQAGIARAERSHSNPVEESDLSVMNAHAPHREVADLVAEPLPLTTHKFESVSSSISSQPERMREPTIVAAANKLLPVNELNEKVGERVMLSGSSVFEAGRSEAIVVNRQVTEASVVLVTLTANPGPVVVQYVTLQPHVGFTVHLTAPTTMRATFNYIVLQGKLF